MASYSDTYDAVLLQTVASDLVIYITRSWIIRVRATNRPRVTVFAFLAWLALEILPVPGVFPVVLLVHDTLATAAALVWFYWFADVLAAGAGPSSVAQVITLTALAFVLAGVVAARENQLLRLQGETAAQ